MLKNRDIVEIFSDLVYISQKQKKNLIYKSLNLMSSLSRRNNSRYLIWDLSFRQVMTMYIACDGC